MKELRRSLICVTIVLSSGECYAQKIWEPPLVAPSADGGEDIQQGPLRSPLRHKQRPRIGP